MLTQILQCNDFNRKIDGCTDNDNKYYAVNTNEETFDLKR